MTPLETPSALKNDAQMLAQEARAFLEATANITDEKVAEARERLSAALESGKLACASLREKATQGVQATDQVIRNNPYQSIVVAFGVGVLLGYFITRRD